MNALRRFYDDVCVEGVYSSDWGGGSREADRLAF